MRFGVGLSSGRWVWLAWQAGGVLGWFGWALEGFELALQPRGALRFVECGAYCQCQD